MSKIYHYLLLSLIVTLFTTITLASSTLMPVFTDLEPDDLVAISGLMGELHKTLDHPTKLLFVVGEGDSYLKKVRMEKLLQQYNLPKHLTAQVLITSSSSEQNEFDGMDCLSKEELEVAKKTSQALSESDREKLISKSMKEFETEIISHSGEIILFILKPLRQELSILSKLALSPKKYLKKARIFFYEGRFNISNTIAANTEKFTVDSERFKLFWNFLNAGSQPPFIVSNSHLRQYGYPTAIREYRLSDIQFPESMPIKDKEKDLLEFNRCSNQFMQSLAISSSLMAKSIKKHVTLWSLKMLREFHSKIKSGPLQKRRDQVSFDSAYAKNFDSLIKALQDLTQEAYLSSQSDEVQKWKSAALKESITKFERFLTTTEKLNLSKNGLEWSVYTAISKYPDFQVTLADYQPIMGFFHPEFFQTELQIENLGPLGMFEKYSDLNPKNGNQVTLTVNRAKRIKASFCEYLAPLTNALNDSNANSNKVVNH